MTKSSIRLQNRVPNYVTPYYPKATLETGKRWERDRNMPVLVLAFDHLPGTCPNCSGVGTLYMKLTDKGPLSTPGDAKSVYTWFDGNERFGKGFYRVAETLVVDCPKCRGEVKK